MAQAFCTVLCAKKSNKLAVNLIPSAIKWVTYVWWVEWHSFKDALLTVTVTFNVQTQPELQYSQQNELKVWLLSLLGVWDGFQISVAQSITSMRQEGREKDKERRKKNRRKGRMKGKKRLNVKKNNRQQVKKKTRFLSVFSSSYCLALSQS